MCGMSLDYSGKKKMTTHTESKKIINKMIGAAAPLRALSGEAPPCFKLWPFKGILEVALLLQGQDESKTF